ncbi:BolA family transcriptional regulator [Myxococcota bacterium]|jgi:BolA protein|nr:BolA family transcriptional regulator [Myxococcota bacterium]
MNRPDRIESKLREHLGATHVEVIDESHLHAGHVGAQSGGGHFRVTVVSDRFEGLSTLQSQRLVFQALAEEMQTEIHALSMSTFTVNEWSAR